LIYRNKISLKNADCEDQKIEGKSRPIRESRSKSISEMMARDAITKSRY